MFLWLFSIWGDTLWEGQPPPVHDLPGLLNVPPAGQPAASQLNPHLYWARDPILARLDEGIALTQEALRHHTVPWARRTLRLAQRLVALGIALGGTAGVRLGHAWDLAVSRNTLQQRRGTDPRGHGISESEQVFEFHQGGSSGLNFLGREAFRSDFWRGVAPGQGGGVRYPVGHKRLGDTTMLRQGGDGLSGDGRLLFCLIVKTGPV